MQAWAKDDLDVVAWQNMVAELPALGLTIEDCMAQVWYAGFDNQIVGGTQAANQAMHHIPWLKPLTIFYKVPGFKQAEDWLYHWVAKNRYRMPGATAECALPVDDRNLR